MSDFSAILDTMRQQMEAAVAEATHTDTLAQTRLFSKLVRGLMVIGQRSLKLESPTMAAASISAGLAVVAEACDTHPGHRTSCKAMTHHMVEAFLGDPKAPEAADAYHRLRGDVVQLVMAVRGSPLPANHQVRVEAERVLQTL